MATSRQFAQRARRVQERRNRQAITQPTNRELAQQARQNREHTLGQQQPINTQLAQRARQIRERELIACQPLLSQSSYLSSIRHQLGPCNIVCNFCGAYHWIEERIQGSSKSTPQFSTCCESDTIIMDRFQDPPEPLFSLLTDMTLGIFSFR
jgi:hypothetical protein